MKSKELNEIFNKTRRTPNISLTPEQVEELIKDLEVLEEIKENHHYLYNLYKKTEEKRKQRKMTNSECIDYIAQKSNLDFPRGYESDDLIDDKLYGCFIQLDAELKVLEEYRKIMGTPIQDIMKRLKILDILKKCYYVSSIDETLYKTSYGFDNPQDISKIGEYLDGKD